MENEEKNIPTEPLMPDGIYTIESLSRVLGIATSTIRRKASKGEIPARKIWGRFYFKGSEVITAMSKESEAFGETNNW